MGIKGKISIVYLIFKVAFQQMFAYMLDHQQYSSCVFFFIPAQLHPVILTPFMIGSCVVWFQSALGEGLPVNYRITSVSVKSLLAALKHLPSPPSSTICVPLYGVCSVSCVSYRMQLHYSFLPPVSEPASHRNTLDFLHTALIAEKCNVSGELDIILGS